MRPITLTISAFGPYAEKTVLNFDELGLQRLFVITGPTGAGKTTVFEAILYALYGKLSKKGMDPASLRCDFLKPDDYILTFVEFIFEIGGKQYRIRRQPKQWVAKKRGNGRREVGQEVVLECLGHTDFLPLTKISEVDGKVVELIGLEEEQFKKIVMLPQGAFQEFLISGTKEKSELLRNIFNTGLYDLALQRLKGRVSKMSGDYERVRLQYQAQCAMLKADEQIVYGEFPSVDEVENLARVVKVEEEKVIGLSQRAQQADMAYKMAIDDLNKKKQHNEDVRKWQEALAHKVQLAQRGDEIDRLKQRVAEAEKAEPVQTKEIRFTDAQAQLHVMQQLLTDAWKQCEQLSERMNEANNRHQCALMEKKQADADFQKVPVLSDTLTRLQQYRQKKATLSSLRHAHKDMIDKKVAVEQDLNSVSEQINQTEEIVQEQQRLQAVHSEKQVLLMKLQQMLQEDRGRFKLVATVLERHKRLQNALQDEAKTAGELAKKEEALLQARAQNRQHVASSLAVGLEEGVPCPVCGATHHPNKAVAVDVQTDEEQLLAERDVAQKEHLRAQALVEQIKMQLQREMGELRDVDVSLVDIDAVSVYQTALTESGVQNKAQFDQLKQEVDAIEKRLATSGEKTHVLETLKQRQLMLQQEYTNVATQVGQAQGILAQTQKEIQSLEEREGFTGSEDINALVNDIENIKQRHERANAEFDNAQEAHARILVDQAATESAYTEKKAQLEAHEKVIQTLEASFIEARATAFESEAAYFAGKKDITEKTTLQRQIEQYTQAWMQVVTTCDMLEERIHTNKERVDLDVLEAKSQTLQDALEAANTVLSEQKARCQNNKGILEEVRGLLENFKELEQEYAVLGQLRDVLDGKNRFNMRFETFAQAYYFESMLEHANTRLARMTHGRYSFRRKESVRDGRKQAGLDLDVMDQYTGRARDVATLSGGESFKASLSLALGLADVVTGESGGVELSTIFIDEGFGTLDDESLDDTVETLLQLQDSGRLVGVISHVAELKERIPAHLVVTSGKRGSQAHFEVRE